MTCNKITNIPDCNNISADKVTRINAFIEKVLVEPEQKVLVEPEQKVLVEPEEHSQYEESLDDRDNRHQSQWDKRTFGRKLKGIWNGEHRPITGPLKLNLFKPSTIVHVQGGKRTRRYKKRSKKTRKGSSRKHKK